MSDTTIRFAFDDLGKPPHRWQHELELLRRFNSWDTEHEARAGLLAELFGEAGDVRILPPLTVTRGHDFSFGHKVFINCGAMLSGGAPVRIGAHTLIGPNVHIHATTHPVDPTERQRWAFWAKPITIGENVWIGAGAVICAGVTIGDHSVIGAGAIVTRDVPACVLAAGNPAQVVRELTPPDMATLYTAWATPD
ncbi:sugar O-acetyltransferase [Jeongeupia naejangsanensis]|uniref:Sugar O-acetyltransferase n=1 Tax=Jeongeupia naejangsanensis TaxID=613195 RepID=A0ABS2BJE7_9NEIS|nr:sugar O-acetyltransferase [Jeongeupia naejangsanensis]MBM3115726.1 sugar O-acetyltransferase [Jeongeupia naejangsanensis]